MSGKAWPAWRLLRDARLSAGLTQRELADRAGTSQAAIARYESAAVLPNLDTLARLLLACGQRLNLSATPLENAELRQLQESSNSTPALRVGRNRTITGLAARASASRREGRISTLASE